MKALCVSGKTDGYRATSPGELQPQRGFATPKCKAQVGRESLPDSSTVVRSPRHLGKQNRSGFDRSMIQSCRDCVRLCTGNQTRVFGNQPFVFRNESDNFLDMEAEVRHLETLLEQLKAKTNQPLDRRGLEVMEELTGVKQKYLYESIVLRIRDAKKFKNQTVNLHETKLDQLAKYLGFTGFRAFARKIDTPPDSVLAATVGTYYSIVRRNDGPAMLLLSPVLIAEENDNFYYTLKGPVRTYKGRLTFVNGCLFVLMQEPKGKQVHHIYNIGQSISPEILQGIFSAVTTNFEPIGGRTVLMRTKEQFENMKATQISQKEYGKAKDSGSKQIAAYFKEFSKNNLKLNRVVTYTKDDLISGD